MLLAVDIGNTSIKLGLFNHGRLHTTWQVATQLRQQSDEYGVLLLTLLNSKDINVTDIDGVVLCSVVPPLTAVFESTIQTYINIKPLIIEAGIKTGMRICVDNPRELGADRVVNAVAAHGIFGSPSIVIDLGTATTFDVISADGSYIGGVIAPGISIASEALFTHTAVLPRIELVQPQTAIGKNTVTAMQSGMFFGYIGLIENIIKQIEIELGYSSKVIATGGYSHMVSRIQSIDDIVPDLTLMGLQFIYEKNILEDKD